MKHGYLKQISGWDDWGNAKLRLTDPPAELVRKEAERKESPAFITTGEAGW